jgi:hypothetical protein
MLGSQYGSEFRVDLWNGLCVLWRAPWNGSGKFGICHGVDDDLGVCGQASYREELLEVEVFVANHDFHF